MKKILVSVVAIQMVMLFCFVCTITAKENKDLSEYSEKLGFANVVEGGEVYIHGKPNKLLVNGWDTLETSTGYNYYYGVVI